MDYCFGVCGKADSVNRAETCSCWNCCCLIIWGYCVSCLTAIVTEGRFYGIDLFTEDRHVFTRGLGLVGNPVTPCDVIRVYTKENFKGGINNVRNRSNDPVDSRHLQRCADIAHWHTRQCVPNRSGFGCVDTPVCDADWSVVCSVGFIPVGDIRIDYLRDPVDRGQSTDAAPLPELLVLYTLLHLYNYCAAGSALSWTFCDTVWKNLSVEERSLHCSVFPVCQMMEGAALVDNRSGVTFDAELCIPWDAPRAVVDETSTEAFTPVSLPHGVVLFGRDGDVDDRRILPDGDGRVVRLRRPEVCSVNKESCDVRTVVMKEAEELPTSEGTEDTSAGIPTWQQHYSRRDTRSPWRQHWGPVGCRTAPAFPAPALREGSEPWLTAWPLLCPRPSLIVSVVGAGLAGDNKDAAVGEATEGHLYLVACQTGQVGVQSLSRKRLLDAGNEPTGIRRRPMFVNSETGRRCRGVCCSDVDSRTDLDTATSALLHDPHRKNSTRMTEWSRLFGRTPQNWLDHMGRERMVAAALLLYGDSSRMQTNIHDMNQFLAGLYEAASEVLRESLSEQTRSST